MLQQKYNLLALYSHIFLGYLGEEHGRMYLRFVCESLELLLIVDNVISVFFSVQEAFLASNIFNSRAQLSQLLKGRTPRADE